MRFLSTGLVLVAATLLTACASSPKVTKTRVAGMACISDDTSYANTALSPTQASLRFIEVNDQPIVDNNAPVCVAAGRHIFKLDVFTDFRQMAGKVELDLKADTDYWLRAKLNGKYGFGSAFDFTLHDLGQQPHGTAMAFSVPAEARNFKVMVIPGANPSVLLIPQ